MVFLAVLLVIWMTSHLDGLNDICHFCCHSSREARSDCRTSVSAGLSILLYSNVSSANNLAVEWTASGRSLMYARKSRGPKTLPWGTPERTRALVDRQPSRAPCCVRLDRKSRIHVRVVPFMAWAL